MAGKRRLNGLLFAVAGLIAAAAPAAFAQSASEVQRMVIEEAMRSRVPPALALAVAKVESNFEPRAVSPVGAMGVMQIMPKTAREVFGVSAERLKNARLNIQLGINYLEQLYEQYGRRWDLALSHYNGGTLAGGSGPYAIPHDFTRKYVADVLRWQRVFMNPLTLREAAGNEHAMAVTRRYSRIDPLEFGDWADRQSHRATEYRRD
jgi:soluble lytic murein transglycosylase-like protein